MPGEGTGKGRFPPSLIARSAGGENRGGGHFAEIEAIRIKDEKMAVIDASELADGSQKRTVLVVKRFENRLISGNRGCGGKFGRRGSDEDKEQEECPEWKRKRACFATIAAGEDLPTTPMRLDATAPHRFP